LCAIAIHITPTFALRISIVAPTTRTVATGATTRRVGAVAFGVAIVNTDRTLVHV